MTLRKQELENQIAEMESSLSRLKQQLREIEMQEQHDAVDHLDEYLISLDHKWETLRAAWPDVLTELREFFNNKRKSEE